MMGETPSPVFVFREIPRSVPVILLSKSPTVNVILLHKLIFLQLTSHSSVSICRLFSRRFHPEGSSHYPDLLSASHGRTVFVVEDRRSMIRPHNQSCLPETGAVWCEHLVTKYHVTVLIKTEFKFCISNNNTTCQCVVRTFLIKSDCIIAKFLSIFFAFSREVFFKMSNALLIGNILVVVTNLSFCRWCIDWFWKFVDSFNPSGRVIPQTVPFSL